MFPLALYVEEMALFRTPLGKTLPELFYLSSAVGASKSVRHARFLQAATPYGMQGSYVEVGFDEE